MNQSAGRMGKLDQLVAELEIVGWPDGWRVGWMMMLDRGNDGSGERERERGEVHALK